MKSPTLESSDGLLRDPSGLLARPGRAALPASASVAPVRRCAGCWRANASSSSRCSPGCRSWCSRLWKDSCWAASAAVPFLLDVEVHIRFLVVVPLLIVCRACGSPAHAFRGAAIPGA